MRKIVNLTGAPIVLVHTCKHAPVSVRREGKKLVYVQNNLILTSTVVKSHGRVIKQKKGIRIVSTYLFGMVSRVKDVPNTANTVYLMNYRDMGETEHKRENIKALYRPVFDDAGEICAYSDLII